MIETGSRQNEIAHGDMEGTQEEALERLLLLLAKEFEQEIGLRQLQRPLPMFRREDGSIGNTRTGLPNGM